MALFAESTSLPLGGKLRGGCSNCELERQSMWAYVVKITKTQKNTEKHRKQRKTVKNMKNDQKTAFLVI